MYLSRVEVDRYNRQKIKDLTHLGAYHNWVEQSFPNEVNQNLRSRHLWRLDRLMDSDYLLVLSNNKPDTELLARYGIDGTVIVKNYDQFLEHIKTNEVMRFRLTANPTYTITEPGKTHGHVYPHITVAQQRNWLITRAEASGFKLIQQLPSAKELKETDTFAFDITHRDYPVLYRKAGHGIRLSRVTFEGLLEVQELAAFKNTLVHGLGREKAFGMGLMTVIPER